VIQNLSTIRRNAALGVLALFFVWFVWSIREVVNPLLLGYLSAFILHPMVSKLESRGMSRRRSVNTVFMAWFLGGVLVMGGLFTQVNSLVKRVNSEVTIASIDLRIDKQVNRLDNLLGIELPRFSVQDFLDISKAEFGSLVGGLGGEAPGNEESPNASDELDQLIESAFEEPAQGEGFPAGVEGLEYSEVRQTPAAGDAEGGESNEGISNAAVAAGRKAAGGLGRAFLSIFGSLMSLGGLLFLVPLYAYYLLFHLGTMHSSVKRYLPKRDREKIANVGRQIGAMLAAFFRGRLLVCLLKGAILTVGLLVLRVEYAFLFGMTGGLLSLIPVVGPLIGFLFAAVFSMAATDKGALEMLIRTGLVFGAGEMIEGYLLMPKIIGDSLRMNEVEVLFYLLAGHAAFGMFGILVALPVAAAVKILLGEIVLPALRDFSDELDSPGKEQDG
jgi:predicted PurR-regulated permease PerM